MFLNLKRNKKICKKNAHIHCVLDITKNVVKMPLKNSFLTYFLFAEYGLKTIVFFLRSFFIIADSCLASKSKFVLFQFIIVRKSNPYSEARKYFTKKNWFSFSLFQILEIFTEFLCWFCNMLHPTALPPGEPPEPC